MLEPKWLEPKWLEPKWLRMMMMMMMMMSYDDGFSCALAALMLESWFGLLAIRACRPCGVGYV